jgi:hypothetical protein
MPPTVHEEDNLMRTMLNARFAIAVTVTVLAATCGCSRPLPPPAGVAGCTPPGPLAAPADLPGSLQAPAESQLLLRLRAEGTQIYRCQKHPTGSWAFTLKAPDARLISDRCTEVGHHFAGPSWSLADDGSVVVGKKLAEAPRAGTIPWLLLSGSSASPSGALTSVRFIQRVDTTGGVAPVEGCNEASAGQEVAIPYRATYLLYGASAAKPSASLRDHYRPATPPVTTVSNSRS